MSAAGWRWVFLINLPLAAVVVAVAIRHVPETRDQTAQGRFDVRGATLAALALAGITYALTEAPQPGVSRVAVIAAAVLGAACGAGFVLTERDRIRSGNPEAMMPLDVFASKEFPPGPPPRLRAGTDPLCQRLISPNRSLHPHKQV